ncbi:MAG TPA: hypothetical protein PK122_06885 [Candidatus Paceibacterota bacterium]|nr:hypothetical protein [Candidatus Paceibacterota bacterium]
MGLLSFDKPKKIHSTEEHNKMFPSDSGISGTYVPNMSKEDQLKWKAKHIKGDDERVEIRKEFGGANLVVIVYKNPYDPPYPEYPSRKYGTPQYEEEYKKYKEAEKEYYKKHDQIKISSNGTMNISWEDWRELQDAIKEAFEILL